MGGGLEIKQTKEMEEARKAAKTYVVTEKEREAAAKMVKRFKALEGHKKAKPIIMAAPEGMERDKEAEREAARKAIGEGKHTMLAVEKLKALGKDEKATLKGGILEGMEKDKKIVEEEEEEKEKARRAAEEARDDKMYQLQREQFELQKKQLAELEMKEKGKKAAVAEMFERLLKRKRTGRTATILTDFERIGLPPVARRSLYAVR